MRFQLRSNKLYGTAHNDCLIIIKMLGNVNFMPLLRFFRIVKMLATI